jgi:hypothetical protein
MVSLLRPEALEQLHDPSPPQDLDAIEATMSDVSQQARALLASLPTDPEALRRDLAARMIPPQQPQAGPHSPAVKPRSPRPRCGAKCRSGKPCKLSVVMRPNGELATRCNLHGGRSTGPRTDAGRARSLEALARGRARRTGNTRGGT